MPKSFAVQKNPGAEARAYVADAAGTLSEHRLVEFERVTVADDDPLALQARRESLTVIVPVAVLSDPVALVAALKARVAAEPLPAAPTVVPVP